MLFLQSYNHQLIDWFKQGKVLKYIWRKAPLWNMDDHSLLGIPPTQHNYKT